METTSGRRAPTLLILAIGIIVGLLIAGGFALVKSGLSNKKKAGAKEETRGLLLSISKPNNGSFVTSDSLTITGSTGIDAVIVVTGGGDDVITETAGGNFSTKTKLLAGENELVVYAFNTASGASAQTPLNILYLKQELATGTLLVAASNTTAEENNTARIEQLRQRLATESAELKKASSAAEASHIFGSISSINGEILTVESTISGVKTVFTDDLTKFFSVANNNPALIALADLKVGDRIAAAGIAEDNTTGIAKLIIRQEQTQSKKYAVAGKVKSTDGTTLTLSDLTDTSRLYTVTTNADSKITVKGADNSTVADAKVGDVVVACGSVNKDGSLTAKRLFVLPAKPTTKPAEATSSASPSAKP